MPRAPLPYSTEYLLLGLIRMNPTHPYDLHKHLIEDDDLRLVWRFNQSQLYATLDKLEKAGYIFATIQEGTTYPIRKIYTITDSGCDLFDAWLQTPVSNTRNLRRDFLMKLYFLLQMPVASYREIIEAQLTVCRRWQKSVEANASELADDALYQHAVLGFRNRNIRACIDWLEDCLRFRSDEPEN